MDNRELIKKITAKREFSQLKKEDIERALKKINKKNLCEIEKIKLARDLLRRAFSSFSGKQVLGLKDKDAEWFLKRHLSTKERLSYYKLIYNRILEKIEPERKIAVFDLGAGLNGFSYAYLSKINKNIEYIAIESIGQFVNLMNFYFKKNNFNAVAYHSSLFNLTELKSIISRHKRLRIFFLFKVVDSLEILERNYTKKLLLELKPFAHMFVLSFAEESFINRERFRAKRTWILRFIKDNFKVLDDFVFSGERYIVFK